MLKLVWGKFALLVTVSLFASSLPTSASVVCLTESTNLRNSFTLASRDYGRDYGTDGRSGSSGRAGRDGRSGQSQTVFADGSAVNLELSGSNGEDGEDGTNGTRPYCYDQPSNVSHDVQAPDGGSGGVGGRGGDGGNGGSLTVYYSNLDDLRKILVRATGGESGRGGRGGNGAEGCRCRKRDWEIESCTGTSGSPDYKCTKKTYRCHDGRDGQDGSDGSSGKRGSLGVLSIIKGKETLAVDNPSVTKAISELGSQQFNLSKNKWNLRTGATSLLAPGSIIADEYREFDKRLEGTFQLVWQDKQPISRYGDKNVKITLNDNNQMEVDFPEDLWLDGSAKTEGNITKYTVNSAIPRKDVTRLAVAEFAGSGQNLSLKIVDLAARSDVINTRFRVKYRIQDRDDFRGFSDYQKVYEGDIPAELVSREYNRFSIALGKLQIPNNALRSGLQVDIELEAIRSLGGRSAKQNITWQGSIRR
jgi:hypothetical protein